MGLAADSAAAYPCPAFMASKAFRSASAAGYDGQIQQIETSVKDDPVTGKLLDVQPEGATSSRESHTCLLADQQLRAPNIHAPACRAA